MHHKFLVVDDARVWVASANFTRNSFCTDWNNAIVVDQAEIVAAYLAVFQRLFVDGQFGPQTPADPVPAGGAYTVHFSPESPVSSPPRWFNEIATAMGTAATSIEVMLNAWTRTEISDAAIAAHGRGVAVRVVVDDTYLDDAPAQAMLAAGIGVRAGNCHHKVMVVDDALVVTGSANWSENAWSNNENSLWIRDAAVAAAYGAEFELVWADASPPSP
jgi:phosphatidylserine/phosphatidylglycerophosphate/cardiolipin synthase-like enzyme